MSAILKINNFISVFIDALKSLFYIRLWTPFFIFFVISLAFAYIILNPYSGFWTGFVTAIGTSGIFGGGEAFTHYPQHLFLSPSVHSRINLILSVILDSLLTGAAFAIFAGFFSGEKVKFSEGVRIAFSKYHWLVLANIIIYAILIFVQWLLPEIFIDMLIGNPRRVFAFIVALKVFMFLALSPFVYVIPYIVLNNENLFSAILKSIKFFFRNFFSTFFAIFITQLIVLPLSLGLDYSSWVADKFSPETIAVILYLEVFVTMIASLLLTAMLTRFFIEYNE